MSRTLTLLPLGIAAMLSMQTEVSAQNGTTFGKNVRASRGAGVHPQLPLAERGTTPANDDCANAAPIAMVTLDGCSTSATPGDNGAAATTTNVPTCDASDTGVQDVWYTFNSGANAVVYITLTQGEGMTDYGVAVLDACEGTELACAVMPNGAVTVEVAPETDYYVQVYSNLDYGVGGAFTICAAYDNSPVPTNDNCSSVTPEALAMGGSLTFTGTTAGATITNDFVAPANQAPAVWHGITLASCATVTIDYCGTTPAFTNGYGILSSSCPSDAATNITFTSANDTTCGDGNFTITFLNVPAGTYHIPVWSEVGVAYGPYTLNVAATACIDPPANNDCAGAVAMNPTTSCEPVSGTTLLATESMPGETCSTWTGTANDDVWYSFVATNTNHTISIATPFDAALALYRGSCDGLQPITCIDTVPNSGEEFINVDTLTVGNTYYYRLYSYSAAVSADPTFTTCVTGPEGTGLAEHVGNMNWSLFPNPSNGAINIHYGGSNEQARIEILDLSGRLIHSEQRYLSNGQRITLDLNGRLANGAYNVRLTTSTGRSVQRVVVE